MRVMPLRKSPIVSRRQSLIARPAILRARSVMPGFMPHGAEPGRVIPGSVQWTSPGTYSLLVPNYNTFNLDLRAGGGGGSGGARGDPGGHTHFIGPVESIAYGGGGGYSSGVAHGGGINGTVVVGGGAAGGYGIRGSGGYGGRVYRSWTRGEAGAPSPHQTYQVIVGSGGASSDASPGANGAAFFSWA